MTRYEIHIPGPEGTRVERVHGDNWLDALRRGLAAAGLPAPNRNLGVAFGEGGAVDITDADAERTYKVVPAAAPKPRATRARAATGPQELVIDDAVDDPFSDDEAEDETGLPVRPPVAAAPAPRAARPAPRAKRLSPRAWGPYRRQVRTAANAPERPGMLDAGAGAADPGQSTERVAAAGPTAAGRSAKPAGATNDPLLRDVAVFDQFDGSALDAAAFLLDRAMAHVPSAAGSVLLIHPRERCFYFAAVRGTKADALADQRVPLEVGLVGHCVRTRKSLNVADPARDPRFARSIADKVGYMPSSIVCLPIIAGRRTFGVLELLDRLGEERFGTEEEARLRRASRKLGALLASQLGL